MLGKDRWGIEYKFPLRTCKDCKKYPCISGMNRCKCDFARYGCLDYA